mgnify:CR=1 FL=1
MADETDDKTHRGWIVAAAGSWRNDDEKTSKENRYYAGARRLSVAANGVLVVHGADDEPGALWAPGEWVRAWRRDAPQDVGC